VKRQGTGAAPRELRVGGDAQEVTGTGQRRRWQPDLVEPIGIHFQVVVPVGIGGVAMLLDCP
jgi:hypothetical protein